VIKHNFDQLNFGQPTPCLNKDYVERIEIIDQIQMDSLKSDNISLLVDKLKLKVYWILFYDKI
jgi:hypothetical protein